MTLIAQFNMSAQMNYLFVESLAREMIYCAAIVALITLQLKLMDYALEKLTNASAQIRKIWRAPND